MDLGCYESPMTVSVVEAQKELTWFFDMERSELILPESELGKSGSVEVFDLSGRCRLRFHPQQSRTHIDLPSGAYVARTSGRAVLRFVVL